MSSQLAQQTVQRLAAPGPAATEADIQSDVATLLLCGDLCLTDQQVVKIESQVGDGTRRRIDIEIGQCVIEVKKDLRVGKVLPQAESQLAGYLEQREAELGGRFAGILTDGIRWRLYRLAGEDLAFVTDLVLNGANPDADRLLAWLDSIVATQDKIKPTPAKIAELLGSQSPAHQFDHAVLRSMIEAAHHDSEVQLKKQLWARLLRTAFGEAFSEDDRLFVNHTLLVITAEAIAHEIIGFDLATGAVTPADMVSGAKFAQARVYGVVEEDFFDWAIAMPGGLELVATIMRRVSRFDWEAVEHDVLKVLYESVIDRRDREQLGEYYTADWLAEAMVADAIDDPVNQRILDPACGSGTFLFHAARAYLTAAEAAGISEGAVAALLTERVFGLDVHPVAVTLARVTYLMAIGTTRLQQRNPGPLSIPVFLGDALQWERHSDLLADEEQLTVTTHGDDLVEGGGGALFGDDLIFPISTWQQASRFDTLVLDMGSKITGATTKLTAASMNALLRRHKVPERDQDVLRATFEAWYRLHASGRDHIWSYYIRNLVKPLWLSQPINKIDVLIGNPPWLRYSKMTPGMQERYKQLARPRQLLIGGLGASARDLATLFAVRSIELYLGAGGRFAFVMPHGTLTRRPHTGFRSGDWGGDATGGLDVTFDTSWDTSKAHTGFPMTSCVVRGTLTPEPIAMTETVEIWQTPRIDGHLTITRHPGTVGVIDARTEQAHYEPAFRQGAILVPRSLLCVNRQAAGPLGLGGGRTAIKSMRSNQEKQPWKDLDGLDGVVEDQFLRPMLLGSTLAPFRTLEPWWTVLPIDHTHILSPNEIDSHDDLADWWGKVEAQWETNRVATETLPLAERFDFHGQLSAQFPLARDLRVVYPKSGNTLCAAIVTDPAVIIDHKLYWAPIDSIDEARYLVGMLNAPALLDRVRRYQTIGLFGARDFDKYVFRADFPAFDSKHTTHQQIADLAAACEQAAVTVDVSAASTFQKARKLISARLQELGLLGKLNDAVTKILG